MKSKSRRPLVLRGARQVGKSTLVRLFAAEQQLELLEINLERHTYLNSVFASFNLTAIVAAIEDAVGQILSPRSLLFLDEIQATPAALAALRYFYEERPSLPVIAAGSLLELILPDLDSSMPVGRIDYFHLGPCSFAEYLDAVDDGYALTKLQAYRVGQNWSQALHQRLNERISQFLQVGGMPEALATYAAAPDDRAAWLQAQQRIVDTYQDDFSKYRKRGDWAPVLQDVYRRLPAAVGQKVKYTELAPGQRVEKIHTAIDMLAMARVIMRAAHVAPPQLPLEAHASNKIYKIYWLDAGLLSRQNRANTYGVADQVMLAFKGMMAEQFVAQHLAYAEAPMSSPKLFYWLREGKADNAEVDFLVQIAHVSGPLAIPVEVKSGASARIRSLQQFVAKYHPPFAVRLHPGAPQREEIAGQVLYSLPLYMAQFLPQIFSHVPL